MEKKEDCLNWFYFLSLQKKDKHHHHVSFLNKELHDKRHNCPWMQKSNKQKNPTHPRFSSDLICHSGVQTCT